MYLKKGHQSWEEQFFLQFLLKEEEKENAI